MCIASRCTAAASSCTKPRALRGRGARSASDTSSSCPTSFTLSTTSARRARWSLSSSPTAA
eukprot:581204-Pyramimonas_sp.AAC.1